MVNFVAYNPVKLYFGKKVIEKLPGEIIPYGKTSIDNNRKREYKKIGLL